MKALVCRQLGSPPDLRQTDIAAPPLLPGSVRIRVAASSLNFPDLLIVQGKYQVKAEVPFVPGSEAAGTILEVAEDVHDLRPGQRVVAFASFGAFAEEWVVPATQVAELPRELDFISGAAFLLAYGTSYHALINRGRARSGETLLVLGAAGGVGLAAVEIGRACGLSVIAAASTKEKLALCREHGAEALIQSGVEDLRVRLKELTGGRGVDVVYDPVGGALAEPALRSLAWRGRYLAVGFASGQIPSFNLNLPLLMERDILGVHWGAWIPREPASFRASVEQLGRWHAQRLLRPHISSVVALSDVPDVLGAMHRREVLGKVVIDLAR